ncbi:MAG: hypothetical protein Fur0021_18310 [Candidatus Promineifilaceae bacterium]
MVSPIDLLSMSATEQVVLRTLTQRPRLTISEMAAYTGLPALELDQVVTGLVQSERLVEQLQDGKRVFSTRFQFKRRTVRNMPALIQSFLDQSPDNFLSQTPLTANLEPSALTQLWQMSSRRTLMPNEVLAWQGNQLSQIGVIQTGLLARTRLRGQKVVKKDGYLRRSEWVGLVEAFSQSPVNATYTAGAETILLLWDVDDFFRFVQQQPTLAHAISRYFSQKLQDCERASQQGAGKLWVVEGARPGAGASVFAATLARIAQQNADDPHTPRTLFWAAADELESDRFAEPIASLPEDSVTCADGLAYVVSGAGGVDHLRLLPQRDYPIQVQLDMLLADLLKRYEYVICDTGRAAASDEWLLRLRGQAHTLITVTDDANGAEESARYWNNLQPYALPTQKKVLALNRARSGSAAVDPRFHLVIPADDTLTAPWEADLQAAFAQALQEVYRRLSLNHALAIFVPSTVDVNQQTDNTQQVQQALAFLGSIFGGATSSNAEGVWRSEESGLVTEQVTIVRTFVSAKALESNLDSVIDFASGLKRDMKQEAVAISIDNQLILV